MNKMPEDGERIIVCIQAAYVDLREILYSTTTDRVTILRREIPHFSLELNHPVDRYGNLLGPYAERERPYLLQMPIADVLVPSKTSGPWTKRSGSRLAAATGVTELLPEDRFDTSEKAMGQYHLAAEKMTGMTVRATVRHVFKEYVEPTPKLDENGMFLRNEHGDLIHDFRKHSKAFDHLRPDVDPVA